jgi:hypothetical protein
MYMPTSSVVASGLDASVSRRLEAYFTPRLGLASGKIRKPRSRLGLGPKSLGPRLGLDSQCLGSRLGLGMIGLAHITGTGFI